MATPVAITGLGAVTPAGGGVAELWAALFDGRECFSEIDLFEVSTIACRRAGVCGLSEDAGMPRALRLALGAAREALNDAEAVAASGTALIAASNFFSYAEQPEKAREPDAQYLASALSLNGIRFAISLSCASGASAAIQAARLIEAGRAQRVLVVGYDALAPFSWSGLCSLRTMSKERPRPFSANRDGTIFSEGAVAAVFESPQAARARQVRMRALLTGWATGNNAYHLTAPPPRARGSKAVMARALDGAGLDAAKVDAVVAHATGTVANDSTESEALADVFGATLAEVTVTGIKGAVGHLMGGSGLAELICAVRAIESAVVPPCRGREMPDAACVPNLSVESGGVKKELKAVLCNAAGFGGCNAAMVVEAEQRGEAVNRSAGGRKRVFVKGVGAVGSAGFGLEEIAVAFAEGDLGDGTVPEYELTEFGVTPKTYVDDVSKHALCASAMALEECGGAEGVGLAVGTEGGCVETTARFWEDYLAKGARFVRPFLFPHTYDNAPASLMAMEFSAGAMHINFSGAAAGEMALVAGFDAVASGEVEQVVVCGCDEGGAASLVLSAEPSAGSFELFACGIGATLDAASAQLRQGDERGCDDEEAIKELSIGLFDGMGAMALPLKVALARHLKLSGILTGGVEGCRIALAVGAASQGR